MAQEFIIGVPENRVSEKNINRVSSNNKKGACYVAACVYVSYDCPQVWTLRPFRDAGL